MAAQMGLKALKMLNFDEFSAANRPYEPAGRM
jgi:hypothetical protein